jgi:hypothetical protein
MKKILIFLITLLVIVFLLSSCAIFQAPAAASLGQQLTLGVGQSIRLADEGMDIRFVKIIDDNRSMMLEQLVTAVCTYQCPTKVEYIWEGFADTLVTIRYQGRTYSIVLKQPGLTNEAEDSFASFKIKFNILPYPNGNKAISEKDYKLTLTIMK